MNKLLSILLMTFFLFGNEENGNYFMEALVYFSMTFFCALSFGIIIWRIWK